MNKGFSEIRKFIEDFLNSSEKTLTKSQIDRLKFTILTLTSSEKEIGDQQSERPKPLH